MDTTIEYKISSSGEISPITPQPGGVLGDDNTVTLCVDLSAITVGEKEYIRIDIANGSGGFNSSEHLTLSNGKVKYKLPSDVTLAGGTAQAHLVIVEYDGGVNKIRYSFPMRIYFKDSTAGTPGYEQYSKDLSGLMLKAKEEADRANECSSAASKSESAAAAASSSASNSAARAQSSASEASAAAQSAAASEANVANAISEHNINSDAHSAKFNIVQSQLNDKVNSTFVNEAVSAHNKADDAHLDKFNIVQSQLNDKVNSTFVYEAVSAHNKADDVHAALFGSINSSLSGISGGLSVAVAKGNATADTVAQHTDDIAAINSNLNEKVNSTFVNEAVSAHNADNNAHEGPFSTLRTYVIGVNSGLSSAKDKLNLLQKYPCYEYTASGGAVQRFDDVSVIEHNIGVTVHGATDENGNSVTTPTVKVYGKNLFSLSEGESGNGFTFSGSNCKIENPTSYYYTLNSTDRIKLPKGTYTFTANVSGSIDYGSASILLFSYPVCGSTKTLLITKSDFESGTRIFTDTFTAEEAFEFYIERVSFDGRTPTSADLSIDLQLEVGDTMTDYADYVEPQTASFSGTLTDGEVWKSQLLNAVSPTMTVIASDDNGLMSSVDVTYNRDVGKAINVFESGIYDVLGGDY